MLRAYALFVLAGLAEIGGGYLVWQWLRDGRSLLLGLLGGVILFLYGIIAAPISRNGWAPPSVSSG